jgi:hypothetical protein
MAAWLTSAPVPRRSLPSARELALRVARRDAPSPSRELHLQSSSLCALEFLRSKNGCRESPLACFPWRAQLLCSPCRSSLRRAQAPSLCCSSRPAPSAPLVATSLPAPTRVRAPWLLPVSLLLLPRLSLCAAPMFIRSDRGPPSLLQLLPRVLCFSPWPSSSRPLAFLPARVKSLPMLSSSRLCAELLSCARFSLCIDHAPSSSFLMRAPNRSSSLLALQLAQVASICVLASPCSLVVHPCSSLLVIASARSGRTKLIEKKAKPVWFVRSFGVELKLWVLGKKFREISGW